MATETKYTTDETWLRIDADTAMIGITNYAQEQLNDLVFVKPPDVGQRVAKGKEAAMVESVKTASDVHTIKTISW